MPRPCVICLDPRRADMELDIVSGLRPPTLHEKYRNADGIPSEGSFRRHTGSNHLGNNGEGSIIVRSRSELLAEADLTNEAIVNKLAAMVSEAEQIQDRARENEQPTLELKALAEIRNTIALIHKFAVKDEETDINVNNPAVSLELASLAKALRKVLPNYPDVRDEIAAALISDGAVELAGAISSVKSSGSFRDNIYA